MEYNAFEVRLNNFRLQLQSLVTAACNLPALREFALNLMTLLRRPTADARYKRHDTGRLC